MRWPVAVAVTFLAAWPARAQMSADEARQRMLERQKQRAVQTRSAADAPVDAQTRSSVDERDALHQAWQDLIAHQYAPAIRLFDDALHRDPRNARALEGRAICEYESGKYEPAARDAAAALAMLARDRQNARQANLVAAAIALAQGNPLKAMKLTRDVMQTLEGRGQLDEPLQDVLGAALWRINPQERFNPLVQECGKYYMDYDAKLAANRNDQPATRLSVTLSYDTRAPQTQPGGQRRWGAVWLEAGEAERKWQAYVAAVAAVDSAVAEEKKTAAMLSMANRQYDQAHFVGNKHSAWQQEQANSDLLRAQAMETKAQAQLANAVSLQEHAEAPPFPAKAEPVWIEPGESHDP